MKGHPVTPKPAQKEAFIGFNLKKNRLYGNTGCNNLVGGIQADPAKGTMSFGQTGSTRMMCPDMDTEQKVLGAMGKVARYEIPKGGKLSLKADDGKAVMTLEKRKFPNSKR